MRDRRPIELAVGIAGVLFLLFWPFILGRRVPLLGWADLGFHELGHLIATPFGRVIHTLAGSTTQVLVPLGLAGYFWLSQRDRVAAALMLGWAAASLQDASVYIADAPYQHLPLIGGHHDWSFLLGRWRLIDQAGGIAKMVWFAGLLVGGGALWTVIDPLIREWRNRRRDAHVRRRFARAPVRAPRNPDKAPGHRSS